MKKLIVAAVAIIVLFSTLPLFAAEAKGAYYEKGSTMFTVKAGVGIPAFYYFPNNTSWNSTLPSKMNTKIGGYGALSYQVFVSPKTALGGELGYAFNYSNADKILSTVPVTFKLSLVPIQTGKFDFIFATNIGVAYNKYNNVKRWAPYVNITLNPTFYFGRNWGLGISGGLWANYDMYFGDSSKGDNCLMGMIPATLAVSYRK